MEPYSETRPPHLPASACHIIERVQRIFLCHAAYKLNISCPPHDYTPIQRLISLESLADRVHLANLSFLSNLLSFKLTVLNHYLVFHLMSPPAVHDHLFHSISVTLLFLKLLSSVLCALPILNLHSLSKIEPRFHKENYY